jgi:hypothetical protein
VSSLPSPLSAELSYPPNTLPSHPTVRETVSTSDGIPATVGVLHGQNKHGRELLSVCRIEQWFVNCHQHVTTHDTDAKKSHQKEGATAVSKVDVKLYTEKKE